MSEFDARCLDDIVEQLEDARTVLEPERFSTPWIEFMQHAGDISEAPVNGVVGQQIRMLVRLNAIATKVCAVLLGKAGYEFDDIDAWTFAGKFSHFFEIDMQDVEVGDLLDSDAHYGAQLLLLLRWDPELIEHYVIAGLTHETELMMADGASSADAARASFEFLLHYYASAMYVSSRVLREVGLDGRLRRREFVDRLDDLLEGIELC